MTRARYIFAAVALSALVPAVAAEPPAAEPSAEEPDLLAIPLFASAIADVRTAYYTRGRVCEDRPVGTTLVRAGVEPGPLGKIGFWNWTVSGLTPRRQHLYRRAFHEVDMGVFWRRSWEIAEDWSWTADLMADRITLPGARRPLRGRSDHSIQEFRFYQKLDNPWLIPWTLVRRGTHPTDWVMFRVGADKPFGPFQGWTITPSCYCDLGNENLFEYRYGGKPGGGRYRSGPAAVIGQLEVAYRVNENFSVFATVSQIGLVSHEARDGIMANGSVGTRRRDLTFGSVGVKLSF